METEDWLFVGCLGEGVSQKNALADSLIKGRVSAVKYCILDV